MSVKSSPWGRRFRWRERVARSWLLIPGAYVIAAVALGSIVPLIDIDPLGIGFAADSASSILGAVASGMLTFTALVVSVAVVVVQFGASQYTPRLVLRFRRDPSFKHSLGLFVAPAIYAIVSLGHVGGTSAARSPGLVVTVAVLLLIGAIVAFFHLVARLLDLLRPQRLYHLLVDSCEDAINEVYPCEFEGNHPRAEPTGELVERIRITGKPGVLSAVDLPLLVRAAEAADVQIELVARVGEFVRRGEEVMRVRGLAPTGRSQELLGALVLAEERTLTQDPSYAIRTIVDIAIRALSPAVNDPTTATQALDALEAILHMLAVRDLGAGGLCDASGVVRVIQPAAGWADLLDLTFTEIRTYGAGAPQVTRRLYAVLGTLEEEAPAARRAGIRDQRALLDAAVSAAQPDPREREIASHPDHTGLGGRGDRPLRLRSSHAGRDSPQPRLRARAHHARRR